MEKFYYEVPSIERKEDAIEFINEFYKFNSNINGTGGLQRFLDNYEGWLDKLQGDYSRIPNEEKVPAKTFFLVRSSDNRIVGMINIRLALNERLRKSSGHIGYCIRPTERGKGYNKINLYLGLKVCRDHGITTVLMSAAKENLASWKTMESLGGINVGEHFNDEDNSMEKNYSIDVEKSLADQKDIYEPMLEQEQFKIK